MHLLLRLVAASALLSFGCSEKSSVARDAAPANQESTALKKKAPNATTPTPTEQDVVTETAIGARLGLSVHGRYRDPAFGAAGLPGLSEDRGKIAYGEELLDGGRGNPNFRLVIRDVGRDRPLQVREVLAPSPRWEPDQESIVRGRIDQANDLLATQEWRQMRTMSIAADDPSGALRHGDHAILVRKGTLEIHKQEKVVLRRPLARLLSLNPACPGGPSISEAFVGRGRLLVRFHFETDGCWRESEYHALRW